MYFIIILQGGEISYESVNDMPYLVQCVNETQRMFTISMTDRTTKEDCEINGIKLAKGQLVFLSYYGLTHDESVYPEPDKFLPERERPNDSFLPFGSGPRVCVAQRFALTELKLCIVSILAKFRFVQSERTFKVPIIDKSGLTKSKDPIFLRAEKR